MGAADELQSLVEGGRKPVDVERIEAELREVWRSASRGEGATGEAVTRACLWNLVVHTVEGRAADAVQAELSELTLAVPARVLLLRTDSSTPHSDLQAWISANCHLTGDGRRTVCTEEIIISATGRTMSDIPPLVAALLVPDVPSALVWMEMPSLAGRHLGEWLEVADRFVFDSSKFSRVEEFRTILDALQDVGRPPELGDLNWHRVRPWRLLTARLFDHMELRELIQDCTAISIAGDRSSMPFSAGLYVGWLASRLGLQMHARAVELDGRVVPVELREAEGAPHLGGIMRVTFHAPGRNLELVHRDECLELCTTGPVRIPRALRERAPELSRTALLVAELEGYHADPMLRAALPLSARFLS